MTIKEYAADRGITYEAARQMVQRHREELGEHAVKDGKKPLELDEDAVTMLDGFRAVSPVVMVSVDRDAELEQLRSENKALMAQVIALQGQLIQEREGAAALAGRVDALEKAALPAPVPAPVPWWRRLFGREEV